MVGCCNRDCIPACYVGGKSASEAITAWNTRHGAGDAEDAARYRWIKGRSMNKSVMDSKQQNGPFIAVGSILTGWSTPNDIDSAIDAARAGERG